jgi:DNA helicase-2/ATP-dependent DNA helicase PcrA
VKQYPLIIVDEAQDTGEHAWMFVAALKNDCQIVCLADLEQQIFDYLPGIGPERIAAIRNELCPLEVDLGQTNNRSPGTEIAIFAKDVLQNTPRRAPYNGVSRLAYNPIAWDRSRTLRTAIAIVMRSIGEQTGVRPESCAILASTARDVAVISAALSAEPKPVTHKVIFDEVGALLASRFAAFLLEPKYPTDKAEHIAEALELLAAIERSAGTKKGRKTSARYQKWAQEVRQGQQPRAKVVKTLAHLIETLCSPCFQGDPVKDWLAVKMMIRDGGDAAIASMTGLLDYLVAFNRGRRIAANLSALWMELGTYAYARQALDAALAQEALLAGPDDLTGIHVMTIHRSKAKQFDGVILFRSNTPTGPRTWRSSFVWRDDKPPYTRSRKILRVGITRAQKHVLIVDPAFPECPLLHGHIL